MQNFSSYANVKLWFQEKFAKILFFFMNCLENIFQNFLKEFYFLCLKKLRKRIFNFLNSTKKSKRIRFSNYFMLKKSTHK